MTKSYTREQIELALEKCGVSGGSIYYILSNLRDLDQPPEQSFVEQYIKFWQTDTDPKATAHLIEAMVDRKIKEHSIVTEYPAPLSKEEKQKLDEFLKVLRTTEG